MKEAWFINKLWLVSHRAAIGQCVYMPTKQLFGTSREISRVESEHKEIRMRNDLI